MTIKEKTVIQNHFKTFVNNDKKKLVKPSIKIILDSNRSFF